MELTDAGTFETAFRRLSSALRLKASAEEQEQLPRIYFKILQAYPLEAVLEAGRVCATSCRTFPKPADWIEKLPASTRPVTGLRYMDASEQAAQAQAAARRYRDDPCGCEACVAAGVHEHELRFVPTLWDGAAQRAYNPQRHEAEVLGHWAHGEELRRWYLARDQFMGLADKTPLGRRFGHRRSTLVAERHQWEAAFMQVVHSVPAHEREPGQEG